jgi:hypothetical protein
MVDVSIVFQRIYLLIKRLVMDKVSQILEINPFTRIRRNHAMEHASLHILAAKNPGLRMAGYSDLSGFRIIGNFPTEEIQLAVDEALARLQNGEERLAYHPNCGTNYVTAGSVAGLAAWAGMLGSGKTLRAKFNRLPLVILMVTVAMILTRPLGPFVQRVLTIDPVPGSLQIVGIQRHDFGNFVLHRIVTRQ